MTDNPTPDRPAPDRYVSFEGIDCDENTRAVVDRVLAIIADPARSNKFWDQFRARLDAAETNPATRDTDRLRLACSHVYYIEELFEAQGDEEGLALLSRLEVECC